MKRINLLILMLIISVFSIFSFSCKASGKTTAKLVSVNDTEIVMSIEETDGNASAFDALKSLRNNDLISFDFSESVFGAYITSINGKSEYIIESTATSRKGYSWMLYTSDMESAYEEKTITIGETLCGQSSLGASSLKVKLGKLYVWTLEYYDYSW